MKFKKCDINRSDFRISVYTFGLIGDSFACELLKTRQNLCPGTQDADTGHAADTSHSRADQCFAHCAWGQSQVRLVFFWSWKLFFYRSHKIWNGKPPCEILVFRKWHTYFVYLRCMDFNYAVYKRSEFSVWAFQYKGSGFRCFWSKYFMIIAGYRTGLSLVKYKIHWCRQEILKNL